MFHYPIRKRRKVKGTNFKQGFHTVDRVRNQVIRPTFIPNLLQRHTAERLRQRRRRRRDHHRRHQIRVHLSQPKPHHCPIAKPHQNARPLNPQLPQPLHHALRLKLRRSLRPVRHRLAEEEKVRYIDGVVSGQIHHLKLPRHDPVAGESME